jgi:hypothetical protein
MDHTISVGVKVPHDKGELRLSGYLAPPESAYMPNKSFIGV